jgi:hypothetical protein
MFDNFNSAEAPATVPVSVTTTEVRSSPADPVRKRQANAAAHIHVDAPAAKQAAKVPLKPDERWLYEEFLRWREAHELTKRPDQPKEQNPKDLYDEFLRWSRPDPSSRSVMQR